MDNPARHLAYFLRISENKRCNQGVPMTSNIRSGYIGPAIFLLTLAAVLFFFWWLLIDSHGVTPLN